jgi:hypothetical protein
MAEPEFDNASKKFSGCAWFVHGGSLMAERVEIIVV